LSRATNKNCPLQLLNTPTLRHFRVTEFRHFALDVLLVGTHPHVKETLKLINIPEALQWSGRFRELFAVCYGSLEAFTHKGLRFRC